SGLVTLSRRVAVWVVWDRVSTCAKTAARIGHPTVRDTQCSPGMTTSKSPSANQMLNQDRESRAKAADGSVRHTTHPVAKGATRMVHPMERGTKEQQTAYWVTVTVAVAVKLVVPLVYVAVSVSTSP